MTTHYVGGSVTAYTNDVSSSNIIHRARKGRNVILHNKSYHTIKYASLCNPDINSSKLIWATIRKRFPAKRQNCQHS